MRAADVVKAALMPTLLVGDDGSSSADMVRSGQLAEEGPDAPLSLQDIKQAKARRRQEKAVQQGRQLTVELVARRNLGTSPGGTRMVGSLQYIELDRERLNAIPPEVLAGLGRVTRLYLQHNSLQDMACLGSLARLRYLTVAHNSIAEVRGIRDLPNLMALDLSHNRIARLAVDELPQSLQFIQLHDNPVSVDEDAVFCALAAGLPKLRQVDGRDVPASRKYSDSFVAVTTANSSGDKFTNEMIEAALLEMEQSDKGAEGDGFLDPHDTSGSRPQVHSASRPPLHPAEQATLSLSRQSSKGDVPSPVRVTPAASRQTSMELGTSPAEIRDMLARVREALPTVREASDVGLGSLVELSATDRSHSAQGLVAYHRRTSVDQVGRQNVRATSLPVRPDVNRMPPPPGVTGPWSFSDPLSPRRVASALSAALVTLVGSAPPTRELDTVNVWAQTQHHRQQVLGALFARRPNSAEPGTGLPAISEHLAQQDGPSVEADLADSQRQSSPFGASASGHGVSAPSAPPEPGQGSGQSGARLTSPFGPAAAVAQPEEPPERLTVGEMSRRHHAHQAQQEAPRRTSLHRRASSTINEDLLQGLLQRDAPRVEVLSEALQRGSVATAAEQLAELSADPKEKMVAEHARMSLRRGIVKMLMAAQQQRDQHSESEAALLEELAGLKTVKALHGHLRRRMSHSSPQPHVLANIISSHSRLGSITDRLSHIFEAALAPLGAEDKLWGASAEEASQQSDAGQQDAEGEPPLARSYSQGVAASPAKMASPFESVMPPQDGRDVAEAGALPDSGGDRRTLAEGLRIASPFESTTMAAGTGDPQPDGPRQFLVQGLARGSSSSSSSSSGSVALTRRQPLGATPPASRPIPTRPDGKQATIPEEDPRASPLQRKMSVRRRNSATLVPSLSSDSDSNPPRNRQAARPIFGGIAKLVKGPSGQLEPPPSPVPTTARGSSGRLAPQAQDKVPAASTVSGAGVSSASAMRQGKGRRPPPAAGLQKAAGSSSGTSSSSDTRGAPQVSSTGSDSDWRPPHPRTANMARSSTARTHTDKHTMDLRTAAELTAARDATYQNELWVRFSGGADRQARTLTTHSPYSNQAAGDTSPLQLRSPFSAASNTPVSSPFSTASAGATMDDSSDDRLGLEATGSRGKTWSQGDSRAVQQMYSPFSRSRLPSLTSKQEEEEEPLLPPQQSAPPIPASTIQERIKEAVDLARDAPEASSAPPHASLREALRSTLSREQIEALSSGVKAAAVPDSAAAFSALKVSGDARGLPHRGGPAAASTLKAAGGVEKQPHRGDPPPAHASATAAAEEVPSDEAATGAKAAPEIEATLS